MRAVQCLSLDGPGALRIGDVNLPAVGPHDLRIRVAYAALNFMDLLIISGQYQFKPAMPFVPGHDAAGEVIEVGSQVEGFRTGDRVSIGVSIGAFAEEMVVPAARAIRVPESVDLRFAAAYRASYATALYSLRERASLRPGENVLVTGAAGGVGLASLQVAQLLGAKALGIVGNEAKAEVIRAEGANAIVSQSTEGLRDAIMDEFPEGFDVALDTVGGSGLLQLVRAAGWDSRILIVGFTAGIPSVPVNRLLLKSSSLIGVNYGAGQDRDAKTTANIHETLLGWIADGKITPHIGAEFELSRTPEALECMATRSTVGKILIRVG